jgi:hypothetical protein
MTIESSATPELRHATTPAPSSSYDPKRKGEMAELVFVLKAISLGFPVSKPYGDSEPYDLIIEDNHRLVRIQVKSAFSTTRRGYSIGLFHRHGTALYLADEIDFIAAYVGPQDAWYIIPVDQITGHVHIRLYPRGASRRGGADYEQYREAWHLLRAGAPPPER